jgi:hypothetical protein
MVSLCFAVLLVLASPTRQVPAPSAAEKFWIAGRYDGNEVIVYFDKVAFGSAPIAGATKLPFPVADRFFSVVALPEAYVTQLQKAPTAEHFKLGDRYDLLLEGGFVESFTLTTLVGFQNDEGSGNDSYIGALGTMDREGALLFRENYFVATRQAGRSAIAARYPLTASRVRQPVPFEIETQIASRMRERVAAEPRLSVSPEARSLSPAFVIEPFTVSDGSLRYHVRAEWREGRESDYGLRHAFAAWMTPSPTLRILATEQLSFGPDANIEEELLTVVDLGQGRTGAVISTTASAGRATILVEYRDGVPRSQMRVLQTIAAGD